MGNMQNENGYLEPAEFEEAISSSGIVFSDKEKMMLYLAADEDGNGQISYGEFAAVRKGESCRDGDTDTDRH